MPNTTKTRRSHFLSSIGHLWISVKTILTTASVGCFLILLLSRCNNLPSAQEAELVVPSTDTVSVHHARGFSVDYRFSYPLLRLHNAGDTARYWLLPQGVSAPDTLDPNTTIIRTPVQRLVTTSTTHLGLITFLDARERLVGIGRASHVYDSAIQQRARRGELLEVGTDGALNTELALSLQPDLVMVSAMPSEGAAQYEPLRRAGIPIIINAEWQEASPLGKAEWVKLMAVLLGKEALAQRRFSEVATAYDSITRLAQGAAASPSVVAGAPFQGTWYVPGRDSYVGQLLRDAHATWPWANDSSAVSINVSLETVYPFGLEADYWIHAGQHQRLQDLGEDERLRHFQSYQQQRVYNYFRRVNEQGGSDYYESGTVRPDLVLADLVEIFHPDLLAHELYFYQKLQ